MTINYTTLLGLAKPVTGTESGVWGDVVNDQITSLVEDAIANAASISVTAGNVTLTDNNGSSDQSRMAILLVTGSPGVSRNIVAPSTSKWYIVKNSSNAEIVLKGSATTGVTIPAGAEAFAFWNGSDFELAAMIGPSSSTDNAVARFDGTTGKVVQNSAVTIADTTGDITTGGYVFTAAGAQTTPAYSTSGDTNTGMWFPAADTIAFSEGGTEVMRINSSGNVGIGTDSSGAKLEVTGDIQQTWAASMDRFVGSKFSTTYELGLHFIESSRETRVVSKAADSTGLISFYTGVTPTERARITAGGDVGIGRSPSYRLDVLGSSTESARFSTSGSINAFYLNDSGTTAGTLYIGTVGNDFRVVTGSNERMRITNGGDVGIGTTLPGYKLDVNGAGRFGDLSSKIIVGLNGDSISMNGDLYIQTSTANPLILRTDTTERARITSAGWFKASNNGTYVNSTSHEFNSNAADVIVWARNTNATPYGYYVDFTTDANNTSSYIFKGATSGGTNIYTIWSNGTVTARSDQRLKKNIESARNGYAEDLAKLRVVKYNWYNHDDNSPKELGLIAQEVEQVFPGLVMTDNPGTPEESKSVKFSVFVPMLIKAVQELKAELDTVKAELASLKGA